MQWSRIGKLRNCGSQISSHVRLSSELWWDCSSPDNVILICSGCRVRNVYIREGKDPLALNRNIYTLLGFKKEWLVSDMSIYIQTWMSKFRLYTWCCCKYKDSGCWYLKAFSIYNTRNASHASSTDIRARLKSLFPNSGERVWNLHIPAVCLKLIVRRQSPVDDVFTIRWWRAPLF